MCGFDLQILSTPEIIETADGSHSLYLAELDETYHSRYGAIKESRHVFIDKGLRYLASEDPERLSVLEVGMGTGLNVWLTWLESKTLTFPIKMTTLEPNPIRIEVAQRLNYAESKDREDFLKIHTCAWEEFVEMGEKFSFLKTKEAVQNFKNKAVYDLVYFDAFAPSKQPEMWDLSVLTLISEQMHEGSVLVTYCAKGQFKRDMTSLGFNVETLDGPPGKKEMVRAVRLK